MIVSVGSRAVAGSVDAAAFRSRGRPMIYRAYEWQQRLTAPARTTSALMTRALDGLPAPLADMSSTRRLRAACQIMASAQPSHVRPDWDMAEVLVDGDVTPVEARPALSTP